jgi:hypothetical protein
MRRLPVIVGAVTLSVAASAATIIASPDVSGATSSLQSTYKAALAYAGTQNVHYVSKATQQGAILQVVGDTGSTSGKESLVVTEGSTVEKLTTVLVGSTGYIQANSSALKTILGLTSKQSTTYANRWLSFPAGNQSLGQLVSGLRNKDVATELELAGPYTAGSIKTIDGHAAQGINGTTNDSSGKKVPTTLYVETGGTPRPLAEVTSPGKGSTDPAATVTFSNWGQATHVTKPTHTVALLSLVPKG